MAQNAHESSSTLARVAAQVPCGVFILTAAFEQTASGLLVRWVQRCSEKPLMVMVALRKGQPVEPLIRDSHAFAVCQVSAEDRLLLRKFCGACDTDEDLFVGLSSRLAPSGSPIIDRAMSFLDCELVRNIELDSDHRLYVGLVKHAEVLNEATPAVLYGENGTINGEPPDRR